MTEPGDHFETFLKTRTVLPNGMSDDDKLEPSKALDAIVLHEAREAIRARQRPNRTARWAAPVAVAAAILLCLSIVLNVSLNTNRPVADLRRPTADGAPPANPMSEGERRESVGGGASNEVILPEAKVVEPRAPRPAVIAETAAPAPSESLRPDASAAAKADALANGRRVQALRDVTVTTNSAAEKAARLAASTGMAMQRPIEAAPAARSAEAKRSAQLADESRAPAQGLSEATPTSAAGQLARPTDRSPVTATREPSAATAPEGQVEAREQDQPGELAKPKPPAAPPSHPRDPKTWLQQIATLRAEGRTAEADAEMQRFRATFPAYQAQPGPFAPAEPSK